MPKKPLVVKMPWMHFALKLLTLGGRAWLRLHDVHVGPGGWVHGFPSLRMARGSSIELGREVTLNSLSRLNPLAPRAPVSFVTCTPEARIVIGDHAGISNSVVSCSDRIEIGAESLIGADCLIVDCDFHGVPLGLAKPAKSAPIVIGKRVFVGTRALILKGVTIGDGSVIAAGSVVVSDIPPHSLAGGNPAKVIRRFVS